MSTMNVLMDLEGQKVRKEMRAQWDQKEIFKTNTKIISIFFVKMVEMSKCILQFHRKIIVKSFENFMSRFRIDNKEIIVILKYITRKNIGIHRSICNSKEDIY